MDYKELQRKKTLLQQRKAAMPKELLAHMEQEFENQFTYDSLALSGSIGHIRFRCFLFARKKEVSI